jgi:phosphotransferase system enzyme I (PtsI)
VTSLSMSARALPLVRESLSGRTLAECQKLATAARAASDATAARALAAVRAGVSDIR